MGPSAPRWLLAFAFFASFAAGLLSGLAPALHAGSGNLISSLRERGGTAFGGVRLRKCIVTVQVALSLILVIGAALFVRTLAGLLAKGPGFDTEDVLSFAIAPLQSGYSRADAARLIRRLDEVRALSAARTSAVARWAFLTGGSWNEHMTVQTNRRTVTRDVNLNAVSPNSSPRLASAFSPAAASTRTIRARLAKPAAAPLLSTRLSSAATWPASTRLASASAKAPARMPRPTS